jgi:hypothetical protein
LSLGRAVDRRVGNLGGDHSLEGQIRILWDGEGSTYDVYLLFICQFSEFSFRIIYDKEKTWKKKKESTKTNALNVAVKIPNAYNTPAKPVQPD